MAVICNTCGLPEDLCACGDLNKESTKIVVRLEERRFKKKGTMIEGLNSKLNDIQGTLSELKKKYACGGTAKDDYIFLQGDHRETMKDTLVRLGYSETSIEVH
jgi:translation initiation factor 1